MTSYPSIRDKLPAERAGAATAVEAVEQANEADEEVEDVDVTTLTAVESMEDEAWALRLLLLETLPAFVVWTEPQETELLLQLAPKAPGHPPMLLLLLLPETTPHPVLQFGAVDVELPPALRSDWPKPRAIWLRAPRLLPGLSETVALPPVWLT
ncbi:unnamed protein product [Protopolystoma xenopodis]|uniref:Uncharacterized protein n=1 Tax=Protopolystoma xenopodis TaxID=117903 RepID=A0A448X6E6_9PLAT|nr:unnamed protein product [Protopolystoma xenopodis]